MVHSDVHAGKCMIEHAGWHLGSTDTHSVSAMASHLMSLVNVQHLVGVCVLGSSADCAGYKLYLHT